MLNDISILITAAGSELAFSIIKACRLFKRPINIVGCDIREEVLGRYWCDDFGIVPAALKEKEYIDSLAKLVRKKKINIIIPTADAEFPLISRYKDDFLKRYSCHILVNDPEEITRFSDKWFATQWFNENDIPAPRTFLADDIDRLATTIEKIGYPMILKPRFGGGSRSIFLINSWHDLIRFQPTVPKPILQEYLTPDHEEYTAGTYRDRKDYVHVIILKRTLKFGMTNTAHTITNRPDLEDFCKSVILKTNLQGANNIQFRVTAAGPKVLEINPRYSGTTGIRAHCGFNDVEMWVIEALGIGEILRPAIKKQYILRYMEEFYIG